MRNMVALTFFRLHSFPEGFCQGPWQFRRGPKVWSRSRAEARGPPQSAHGGENLHWSSGGAGLLHPPPPHSLIHFLQSVFPRVPAATTTPAEGPPAKVSGQRRRTVGYRAIQPVPIILLGLVGPYQAMFRWCWCWFSDVASQTLRVDTVDWLSLLAT